MDVIEVLDGDGMAKEDERQSCICLVKDIIGKACSKV
jgi:hypothetical protein